MLGISTKFRERTLLVPQYVVDKVMKKMRYYDMLRDDIQEFVNIYIYRTLENMVSRAQAQEIDFGAADEA